jgi:leucyl-tRNA---protein transferase
VTDQTQTRVPQFYLTPAGACPYLAGRRERKVFARLEGPTASVLNDALVRAGFRRSQTIAYRPNCDGCSACVSVRIPVRTFDFSRSRKRILKRNGDLKVFEVPPRATREQYALLRTYLDARHGGGGMDDISLFEYAAMIEETTVATRLFEYRRLGALREELVGCVLTDVIADGLSMVYSFFHPGLNRRSLGTFMILDHIRTAGARGLPYVYLGYWIADCPKMLYKANFRPLEALGPEGWALLEDGP